MSNHSRLWRTRQSSLGKKESQIQDELESVSSIFEGQAKKVLIGIAVVGIVAFSVTMVARSSKKKKEASEKPKKENKEVEKEKTVVKGSFSFKNILLEKITMAVFSFLLTQLAELIKSATSGEKEKED